MNNNNTHYQVNREKLLEQAKNRYLHKNQTKKYYENNKERLQEQVQNKYRELSSEERDIKREYWINRYRNKSEED